MESEGPWALAQAEDLCQTHLPSFPLCSIFYSKNYQGNSTPAAEELNPRYSVKLFRSYCHKSSSFPQLISGGAFLPKYPQAHGLPPPAWEQGLGPFTHRIHSYADASSALPVAVAAPVLGWSDPFYSPRDLSC